MDLTKNQVLSKRKGIEMKNSLCAITMVTLLIVAPAKTLAVDTSFSGPGFWVNADTHEEPNGEMSVTAHLETIHGILEYLSVEYTPKWLDDGQGNWYQSPDEGDIKIHFFGALVPPTEEVDLFSQELSINKLDGFHVFESVDASVYSGIGGLWSQANGVFTGGFVLNGTVKASYDEHLFDNGPTKFSVDVVAPIVWDSGSVPEGGIPSVSISEIPEPTTLVMLSMGLTSVFRRIRKI